MRLVALVVALAAALSGCASSPTDSQALAASPRLGFEASTDHPATFILFLDQPADVSLTLRVTDAAGAFIAFDGPGACDAGMDTATAHHLAKPSAVETSMACGRLPAGAHEVVVSVDYGRVSGTLATSKGELVEG